jgi:hypothetical protein
MKEWLAVSRVETPWWASGVAGPRVVLTDAMGAAGSVAAQMMPALDL